MKNKINLIIASIILIVFLSNFVFASGVSPPYWKDHPMTISPGETKTINFFLQNMVGTEDVRYKVIITKGSEIASIREDEYLVEIGTKNTKVPVEIKIPSEVSSGTNYTLTLSFQTITPSVEGTVTLGIGMDTTFDVLVVTKEPEEKPGIKTSTLVIAAIVILLIIIVVAIISKKKENKTFKKF